MKQIVLYTCRECGKKYQIFQHVEVVNKFAWQKHTVEHFSTCISCKEEKPDEAEN